MKQSDPKKGRDRVLMDKVEQFCALEGRQPRIMISGKGKGLPGKGAAELAVRLADLGFNVDFGPLCPQASDLHRQARENDVDILCLLASTHPDAFFVEEICRLASGFEGQQLMVVLYVESDQKSRLRIDMDCMELMHGNDLDMELEMLLGKVMDT